MIQKLMDYLRERLPRRTIEVDGKPYLLRLYVCGRLPEHLFPGTKSRLGWLPFTIYFHCFLSTDVDKELHSHPWKWAISFILSGWYEEEILAGDGAITRIQKAGSINVIHATTFHRVSQISNRDIAPAADDGSVWTLFIAGPVRSSWGFVSRESVVPWKTFMQNKVDMEKDKITHYSSRQDLRIAVEGILGGQVMPGEYDVLALDLWRNGVRTSEDLDQYTDRAMLAIIDATFDPNEADQ